MPELALMKELGSPTKWRILELLAREGDRTPTQLAKELSKSMVTVFLQLGGLERAGLVRKVDGGEAGRTRPYTKYSIGKGFVSLASALPGQAGWEILDADENVKTHLRIWSLKNKEYCYYVERFWWLLQDHLDKIDAVAVYGSVARGEAGKESDIDVLIMTDSGAELEKRLASVIVKRPGGGSKLVLCEFYDAEDLKKSLDKGSRFLKEVLADMVIIYDRLGVLEGLKRTNHGTA